jgi:hypothetical protein
MEPDMKTAKGGECESLREFREPQTASVAPQAVFKLSVLSVQSVVKNSVVRKK